MKGISFLRWLGALVAASFVAPLVTTLIFFLGLPQEDSARLLIFALPASPVFGFTGALLFLTPAMLIASMWGRRVDVWLIAGAAAGIAHGAAASLAASLSGGAQPSMLEVLAGFLLAFVAASQPMGLYILVPAAAVGGIVAGWICGLIVRDGAKR